MAATYVTEAELRSALGIGNLYSSAVVEEVCQAAENIVKSKLWFNDYALVAHESTTSVATIYTSVPHDFIVGQSINIENAGAKYAPYCAKEIGRYVRKNLGVAGQSWAESSHFLCTTPPCPPKKIHSVM